MSIEQPIPSGSTHPSRSPRNDGYDAIEQSMTYKVPKPIRRPFYRGEIVETCDRDLTVMSKQRVIRVGKRIVVTECGRRWRASDGWWVGENGVWPFPSIRHSTTRKKARHA
jgi:hypothetical protein